MPRNKAPSADNQQERLDYASWIVGFVDGEGTFSVSIFRNRTTRLGWQAFPEFVVTQGAKSKYALEKIKDFFGCGQIIINRRYDNHREDLYRFCVRPVKDLREIIIPFFERYQLCTAKRKDFHKFKKILEHMAQGSHLTVSGLERIRAIASTMNRRTIRGI